MNEFWEEGKPRDDKFEKFREKSRQEIERKLLGHSMAATIMDEYPEPIFKSRKTVDELADELINLL